MPPQAKHRNIESTATPVGSVAFANTFFPLQHFKALLHCKIESWQLLQHLKDLHICKISEKPQHFQHTVGYGQINQLTRCIYMPFLSKSLWYLLHYKRGAQESIYTETIFELLSKMKNKHIISWPLLANLATVILDSTKFLCASNIEAIPILTTFTW